MPAEYGSCYRGLKLSDVPTKYVTLLSDVMQAVHDLGGVIHGGCIRDLLRGVFPVDIDVRSAYSNTGTIDTYINALRKIPNVSAEVLVHSNDSEYCGKRYIIAVDWGRVLSSHSSIIVDMCACDGDEWALLPIDYDVNMLHIALIDHADFTQPTNIISARSESVTTNWFTLRGRYGVDCSTAVEHISAGVCQYPHATCNLITLPHRYSRAVRMVELKFADITDYSCSDLCCAASTEAIRSHYVDKIVNECNTNLVIFRAKFRDHIGDIARRLATMYVACPQSSYSTAMVLTGLPRCRSTSYTLDDISTDSRILMCGQLNAILLEMDNPLYVPYGENVSKGINQVATDKAISSADRIMETLRNKGVAAAQRPASPLQTLALPDIRAAATPV